MENIENSKGKDEAGEITWVIQHETEEGKWRPFLHSENRRIEESYEKGEERALVDGGRMEVVFATREARAVYWEAPSRRVVRAQWFYQRRTSGTLQWAPYEEADQALIEIFYQSLYQDKLPHDPQHKCNLTDEKHHILAVRRNPASVAPSSAQQHTCIVRPIVSMSPLEATKHQEKVEKKEEVMWELAQYSNDFLKIGARYIRRGYEDYKDEAEDECLKPISHLCFVIHGIGENLWHQESVPIPSLRVCCSDFRKLLSSQLSSIAAESTQEAEKPAEMALDFDKAQNTRIEVLPVEWFSAVHSEEMDLTRRLSEITLPTIPIFRNLANDVILDVMMYLSPEFQQKILNKVGEELDRVYTRFMEQNPEFNGKFSILAHSLGSIISFDLMSGQVSSDLSLASPFIHYPQLRAPIHNLVVLGSPIALFLALRSIDIPKDYSLPGLTGSFFNIFHPSDPVAYRIEPLVQSDLKSLDPEYVPFHKGGLRVHLQVAKFNKDLVEGAKGLIDTVSGFSKAATSLEGWTSFFKGADTVPELQPQVSSESSSDRPLKHIRLNGGNRIDYQIQLSAVETQSQYLSALGSHTSYLCNPDVALFCAKLSLLEPS